MQWHGLCSDNLSLYYVKRWKHQVRLDHVGNCLHFYSYSYVFIVVEITFFHGSSLFLVDSGQGERVSNSFLLLPTNAITYLLSGLPTAWMVFNKIYSVGFSENAASWASREKVSTGMCCLQDLRIPKVLSEKFIWRVFFVVIMDLDWESYLV